jgi:hypothetical protein
MIYTLILFFVEVSTGIFPRIYKTKAPYLDDSKLNTCSIHGRIEEPYLEHVNSAQSQ